MSTGHKVPSPEALNLGELAMKKAAPFGLRKGRPPVGYPTSPSTARDAAPIIRKRKQPMLRIRIDVDIWQLALATAVLLNS